MWCVWCVWCVWSVWSVWSVWCVWVCWMCWVCVCVCGVIAAQNKSGPRVGWKMGKGREREEERIGRGKG